ncbi:MAG TPA: tRNA preQ1(34) S-adenosylmethionine ribosyltransferase-isomerase QueA, partial [Myxococcales bacterium]|nr:tRNA preQ1(34) S-adenosylmethionine ribosyltransferase-isomerase QueA [Myxococcales bacterium]
NGFESIFRFIRGERIDDHQVGSEEYNVSEEAAKLISGAQRVVAVGTTSVRTLESLADANGKIRAGQGETTLYITPGYTFKAVDAMLTNFHLPGSSLIVLVAAFAGVDPVMNAYQLALAQQFRFYSYGDAMFIS